MSSPSRPVLTFRERGAAGAASPFFFGPLFRTIPSAFSRFFQSSPSEELTFGG